MTDTAEKGTFHKDEYEYPHLDPCPCCEKKGRMDISKDMAFFVECLSCGLRTKDVKVLSTDKIPAPVRAANLWNRRP